MTEKKNKKDRVLSIRDLNISFETGSGVVNAIRGVRLDLFRGETIAIVGESGSGKSVTVKAIMGILSNNGKIDHGSIIFNYREKDGTEKVWAAGSSVSLLCNEGRRFYRLCGRS